MKILLRRIANTPTYCIGRLYVDGRYVCDTLEDTDRGLSSDMTTEEVLRRKVKHQTAIPTGTYLVDMGAYSAAFGGSKFYRDVCGGRLPRIVGVKGYSGILIHCGNTPSDTSGCILVGDNKVKGKVINSQQAFRRLYAAIKDAPMVEIEVRRQG